MGTMRRELGATGSRGKEKEESTQQKQKREREKMRKTNSVLLIISEQ